MNIKRHMDRANVPTERYSWKPREYVLHGSFVRMWGKTYVVVASRRSFIAIVEVDSDGNMVGFRYSTRR